MSNFTFESLVIIFKKLKQFIKAIVSFQDAIHKQEKADLKLELTLARTELIETKSKIAFLIQENQKLKKTKENRDEIIFKEPFCYRVGELEPYCHRCYEGDDVLIHVLSYERGHWECTRCKNSFLDASYERRANIRIR